MTDPQYKGMQKDRVLELLEKDSQETKGGVLVAHTPMQMRVFNIISDNITLPTTIIKPENPTTMEAGQVTEAELRQAGVNIDWLLHCGAIEEIGQRVVATL